MDGQNDFEGAWPVRIAPNQPQPLELVELVLDRGWTRQADCGADLSHGGGVSVRSDGVPDGFVDGAGARVESIEGVERRLR